MPDDVFNKFSVRVSEDGELQVGSFSVSQKLGDREVNRTWDDVRAHRDKLLSSSDGQIAIDAPEYLQEEFRIYRQRLRDLPSVMQENNVPAHIAFYMFPDHPDSKKSPT